VAKRSLRKQLGEPPLDDSLAAINWMQRALAAMANEVLDQPGMSKQARRDEMLKIADRMAKLRDPDRIYQAEKALRGTEREAASVKRGPQTTDAPDLSQQPRPITARRGRPPRSAIR
jgi:hypothetical protein